MHPADRRLAGLVERRLLEAKAASVEGRAVAVLADTMGLGAVAWVRVSPTLVLHVERGEPAVIDAFTAVAPRLLDCAVDVRGPRDLAR